MNPPSAGSQFGFLVLAGRIALYVIVSEPSSAKGHAAAIAERVPVDLAGNEIRVRSYIVNEKKAFADGICSLVQRWEGAGLRRHLGMNWQLEDELTQLFPYGALRLLASQPQLPGSSPARRSLPAHGSSLRRAVHPLLPPGELP